MRSDAGIDEGHLIAGHYRLVSKIGSGAMGVVWRARDERLDRMVAVKQLLVQPGLSAEETDNARRRAMREGRIAARLQHPNAITLYDVAEHNGDPCLVMEYLPSQSLAEILADRGPLPPREVAAIGAQIAAALSAAHTVGITHRDIKPGNVLITDSGVAKITDFGISRAVGDVQVTRTGMLAGTPAYFAPEVARGNDIGGPTSDVFSLGATLYDAVEGQPPFGTSDNPLALLHAAAAGEVIPPRQAGPLTALLMTMLRRDPRERPNMAQVGTALAGLAAGRAPAVPAVRAAAAAPTARTQKVDHGHTPPPRPAASYPRPAPAGTTRQKQQPVKRKRSPVLLVLLLIVVIGGGGYGVYRLIDDRPGNSAGSGSGTGGASGGSGGGSGGSSSSSASSSSPAAPTTTPPDGTVELGQAGQLVVNYFVGSDDLQNRWNMLSPGAQAGWGSRAEFDNHWKQYPRMYSNTARGAGQDPDKAWRVSIQVTYAQGRTEQRIVRVTKIGGELKIDAVVR
ncbi:serine/threonine-protein kinase [Allokutzneria albata]|uniref:non-specific serine/threonine protein kinase n=1 Tax=Allokutzneria albata TaxID=211114 RepID=A0A1G9VIU5_ALLAB|nr:serine/threonine-protein kinase [Allokutzneria albata]SDM71735.1 Serine/threonine protein kinase [Allokutzneria albata]